MCVCVCVESDKLSIDTLTDVLLCCGIFISCSIVAAFSFVDLHGGNINLARACLNAKCCAFLKIRFHFGDWNRVEFQWNVVISLYQTVNGFHATHASTATDFHRANNSDCARKHTSTQCVLFTQITDSVFFRCGFRDAATEAWWFVYIIMYS